MASWRPGRLIRGTAHAGTWSALRAALQAITLVLLARVFGANGYGALSGTMALYITVAQFVGFGTGISLLRHFSREGRGQARLRATQQVYLLSGLGFFLAAWPVSLWLFAGHLSPFALAALAFAELVVAPALLPSVYRYQASEQLSISGALLTIAPIARCAAILAAMVFPMGGMDAFASFYLAILVAAASLAIWLSWPCADAPQAFKSTSMHIREGLPFAVSGATAVANGELDKAVMLRFAGDIITGQYAAASRVMQAALLPVNSLVIAVAPRWFKKMGTGGVVTGSASLFAAAISYSIIAAVAIWTLAPYLPWLLGRAFDPSVAVLRLLTVAIVTGAIRQIMVMLLTTSDLQNTRNRIEVSSLLLGVGLMLVLIPRYSSAGAVIALVASDTLILALGFIALVKHDNHADNLGRP